MTVRIGVVIHRPLAAQLFAPADRARLERLGAVTWTAADSALDAAAAARLLADCEIGLGSWGSPHPGSDGLLAACPRLRLWEHVAGSVKAMFGAHLAGRELTIATCKGAIADCVAEYVLAEIVLGLRRALPNAAANRLGKAGKPDGMRVLAESTIGVIGASEVGRRVIALLRPFGCAITCYDPYLDEDGARRLGVERVADLVALCAGCDAVTLHTPLLPATRGLLRREHFQAMRDGAVFVNSARGECVDEAALIAELERGRIAAFLDVTHPEPAAPDSPLRRLPNVMLTSHIAGPATTLLGRRAVDDVAAFLAGGRPQCVVTADMLERIA